MLSEVGFGLLLLPEVDPAAIQNFDCGKSHLNDYLRGAASDHHEGLFGRTSVVFHKDVAYPVGYFTLANDSIPVTNSEAFDLGALHEEMPSIPAVKIGRFAVAKGLQGQRVGTSIFKLVLGHVLDAEYLSAARLLIVDADNDPPVIRFYESLGFVASLWAQDRARKQPVKGPRTTVKMLRDVRQLIPEIAGGTLP